MTAGEPVFEYTDGISLTMHDAVERLAVLGHEPVEVVHDQG